MKKLIVIAAFAIGTIGLQAGDMPFWQLSLTPDIANHPKTTETSGLALSVWGENPHHGCALGLVNGSSGESSGFTWAFFVNYDESYTGVAWSMVNISKTKFVGWQSGAVNIAKDFRGLQWGFFNYAENLQNGVQIGFANIAVNNGWFDEFPDKLAKGFPFFNWSF